MARWTTGSSSRVAALVGLVGVLLSVFVVGMVFRAWLAIPSSSSSARMSTGLVVVGDALVLGLMTASGS